jgi:DNA polymerase
MLFAKDRPPDEDETAACCEYLRKQIEIIKPRVIITLGNPSTKFILNTKLGITKIRGNWGEYNGIQVMPTYHPSFVLRNGGDSSPLKKDVWSDIKKVLHYLDNGSDDKKEVSVKIPERSVNTEAQIKEEQGKLF